MRVLICCCRFAPVIVVMGSIKPASPTAVTAQDDVDVTTTRVGSGPSTVQKSAMDGSSGIAIFGMGHNTHPGLPERGSVLQSMLQFATKSKEIKEGRNLTKTHKGDAGAMGNAGEREGSKRNREASGAGERASGRTGSTRQRDKEQIEEARFTKNKVGWGRALWPKHFWAKSTGKRTYKPRAYHAGERNKSKKQRKQRRHTPTDGGVSKPHAQGRKPMNEVLVQARNKGWRLRVKEKFLGKFFAVSTWASKNSKRKRLREIAESVGAPLVPVTPDSMLEVASILDEAGFQAADQYLAELKWMHIEEEFKWDELLERKLAQCKRALKRDSGPEKRALEVEVESLEMNVWSEQNESDRGPRRPAWAYAWAVVWMLRSIEATATEVGHVSLNWDEKKVQLVIPKSKMDQAGKGARRTLACCGANPCERACAWGLATLALSEAGQKKESPLFPSKKGGGYSRLQLVASWQKVINNQMTGHSGRRSGAMMYARKGMQLFDVAFLGRWKSSAVMRYIEEAMEQLAINKRVEGHGVSRGHKASEETPVNMMEGPEVIASTASSSTSKEIKVVEIHEKIRVQEKLVEPKEDKKLWAISRSRSGRVRHWVMQASWGIPLDEWATACGWHFAKTNVRVELTKFKVAGPKECMKCTAILKGRDGVKGGWELAQKVVL